MKRGWTDQENAALRLSWGQVALPRLAKRLGRSVASVRTQAIRLGLGKWSQGRMTLSQVAQWSGYHRVTLLLVARSLGPAFLQRRSPRLAKSPFALKESVAKRLVAEVAKRIGKAGRVPKAGTGWGHHGLPSVCRGHGGADKKHHVHGYCASCSSKAPDLCARCHRKWDRSTGARCPACRDKVRAQYALKRAA